MSDIVKNQHYIPESVLQHFSSKGRVYEVLLDEVKGPYQVPYRNSMSERFTYEHPNLPTNQLEKFFDGL